MFNETHLAAREKKKEPDRLHATHRRAQNTFYGGTLKGVGGIDQQTCLYLTCTYDSIKQCLSDHVATSTVHE